MPPTPQPTTPRPSIIVVWLSVPTSESGTATLPAWSSPQEHALGEVLEVHLVHDARPRRHDAEVVERHLAPAQELVPLAVARELQLDVQVERLVRAEVVDLHRVVDHQVDRHQRVDLLRIAAEPLHRGPHRGEVDDARHAGEVLQHDAGRLERHFDAAVAGGEHAAASRPSRRGSSRRSR